MGTFSWILVAVAVLGYFFYVTLIGKRNKAREALSGIDVQLKLRSNLIPNILTIAKKFMQHEKSLLEEITALRSKADGDYNKADASQVKEHMVAAEQLSGKMSQFMVQVENYPDLKSDKTMLNAQQSYSEVEAKIAAARRFYNSAVTELNTAVQIFPGNIIAGIAKVTEMPLYEADEVSKAPINAGSYL